MLSENLYKEKELLARIAGGDQQAFAELFNQYRDIIYTLGVKIMRSPEASEELVQDVFLKIWMLRGRLGEITDFKNYLFIVTRNQIFRVLKRIARERTAAIEHADMQAVNDTDNQVLDRDYTILLEQAVARLPSQQQSVYRLIKERGYTREQASAELGIHPETVKTHLSQAMKSVRAYCMAHIEMLIILAFLPVQ